MRRALLILVLLAPSPAWSEALPLPRVIVPQRFETGRFEMRAAAPRPVPRASSAAMAAARRYLCPNGGVPQGRGRCAPAARGGSYAGGDSDARGWDQGIAPANRAQAPCPPGTIAAQARDNPGVTRCVAG